MTEAEKRLIRRLPCSQCGAIPPFADGSLCQPHRLLPGSQGGEYVADNVVPLCAACHDRVHGGNGEAPFLGAARQGGLKAVPFLLRWKHDHPDKVKEHARKNLRHLRKKNPHHSRDTLLRTRQKYPDLSVRAGRIGGRRTAALHPDHINHLRRFHETNPDFSSKIMRELNKRYPDLASKAGKLGGRKGGPKGGRIGMHRRWHVNRGIINPACPICVASLAARSVGPEANRCP